MRDEETAKDITGECFGGAVESGRMGVPMLSCGLVVQLKRTKTKKDEE